MPTEYQAAMAKLAADTKRACATSADVIKASASKPGAKAAITGSKAAIITHSIFLSALGGVIVGVAACYLANKYWLSKKNEPVKS